LKSLQWFDSLQGFPFPRQSPVLGQFRFVMLAPFLHQSQYPWRQAPIDDFPGFDSNNGLEITILRMEVWGL